LPSIITTDSRLIYFDSIFHAIDQFVQKMGKDSATNQANDNQWTVFMKWEFCPIEGTDLQTLELEKNTYITRHNNLRFKNNLAFAAYRRPNGIVYKIGCNELDLLKNLSNDQLHFLVNLYSRRQNIIAEWAQHLTPEIRAHFNPQDFHDAQIITLTKTELAIHASLPPKICEILEKNYRFAHLLNQRNGEQ
jgi:hypothetical protein